MRNHIMHKKTIFMGFMCMVIMAVFVLCNTSTVYAAAATVSISSATVEQGEEFAVTVTIKADTNIGAYNFYIDYDSDILEAVSGYDGGGNGRLQLMEWATTTSGLTNTVTRTIKFKAKAPGSSSISYVAISTDDGVIDNDTVENMSVTSSAGSVKVNAPVIASSNSYLSDLKVEAVKEDGSSTPLTLSPSFSKDTTKYSANAEEGVVKLVVDATKEDSKANVKVNGTSLTGGENTTTITVTAEDGSTRKYTIYTTVAVAPVEPVIAEIDGVTCYVENINDAVTLPEGFETFEYDYKGDTVVAAKGVVKDLIVMYITYGDGSAGRLYIYDEQSDTFYPMSNVQITQKLYTIVKEPEELMIPAGYEETTVTVGDDTIKAWVNNDVENVYLVYAMNWNGEAGLYFYDTVENQMVRYFDSAVEAGVAIDQYNSLLAENEKLNNKVNELKNSNNTEKTGDNMNKLIFIIMAVELVAVVVVVLIIIMIYRIVKKRKNNQDDEAEENIEDEVIEDELAEDKDTEDKVIEEIMDGEPLENGLNDKEDLKDNDSEKDDSKEDDSEKEQFKETEPEEEKLEEEKSEEELDNDELEDGESEDNELADNENYSDENITEENIIEENKIEEIKTDEIQGDADKVDTEETEVTEAVEESEKSDFDQKLDEQDEIDELLFDFEDIITAQTVESIEKESSESAENNITEESNIAEDNNLSDQEPVDDKKKKVQDIMNDNESSIKEEDLDLVIDELFDDLFG